jgi:hypothetical protein
MIAIRSGPTGRGYLLERFPRIALRFILDYFRSLPLGGKTLSAFSQFA